MGPNHCLRQDNFHIKYEVEGELVPHFVNMLCSSQSWTSDQSEGSSSCTAEEFSKRPLRTIQCRRCFNSRPQMTRGLVSGALSLSLRRPLFFRLKFPYPFRLNLKLNHFVNAASVWSPGDLLGGFSILALPCVRQVTTAKDSRLSE